MSSWSENAAGQRISETGEIRRWRKACDDMQEICDKLCEKNAKLQADVKMWSETAEAASNDRREAIEEIAKLKATIRDMLTCNFTHGKARLLVSEENPTC